MAKLPIRLGRSAQPEVGAPRSTPSLGFGAGLRQLGQGISNVAIAGQRQKKRDRQVDLDQMKANWLVRMAKGSKELMNIETDSDILQTDLAEFNDTILQDITKDRPELAEELRNQTLSSMTAFRRQANSFAASEAGIVSAQKVTNSLNDLAGAATEDPILLPFLLNTKDTMVDNLAETNDLTRRQISEMKTEWDVTLTSVALDARMQVSPEEAFAVQETLKGGALKSFPVRVRDQLNQRVNAEIEKNKQVAIAGGTSITSAQVSVISEGDIVPSDFSAQRQQMEAARVDKGIIDSEERKFNDAQQTAIDVKMLHNRSNIEVANAQAEVDQKVRDAKSPEEAIRIRKNGQKLVDASNIVLAERRTDPFKAAMRSEGLTALHNERQALIDNRDPDGDNIELDAAIHKNGRDFAAFTEQISQSMYNLPGQIPLFSTERVGKFQQFIASAEATPLEKINQTEFLINSFGKTNANRAAASLFTTKDMIPMSYVTSMSDKRNQIKALTAHQDWDKTKALLDNPSEGGTKGTVTALEAASSTAGQEFVDTFAIGGSDDTARVGRKLITSVAGQLMLEGADQTSAIAEAVQVVTGQFDIFEKYRVNKETSGRLPMIRPGVDALSSTFFNTGFKSSIIDAMPNIIQFTGDTDNEIFQRTPIFIVTDGKSENGLVKFGSGISTDFVVLPDGTNLSFTPEELHVVGSAFNNALQGKTLEQAKSAAVPGFFDFFEDELFEPTEQSKLLLKTQIRILIDAKVDDARRRLPGVKDTLSATSSAAIRSATAGLKAAQ